MASYLPLALLVPVVGLAVFPLVPETPDSDPAPAAVSVAPAVAPTGPATPEATEKASPKPESEEAAQPRGLPDQRPR